MPETDSGKNDSLNPNSDKIPDVVKLLNGTVPNKWLSATPTFLKFPYDDSSKHVGKIILWNKTPRSIRLKIFPIESPIFTINCEKNILKGNESTCLTVTCRPCREKFCFDCIQISTYNAFDDKILNIPIELLPSIDWFNLPRNISIPVTPLGTSTRLEILLPSRKTCDCLPYFFLRSLDNDKFTVEPKEGNIECTREIQRIMVTFTPKEYACSIYKLEICFPEFSIDPYEVLISGICLPGIESEALIVHTKLLENRISTIIWKEQKKKLKFETQKLNSLSGSGRILGMVRMRNEVFEKLDQNLNSVCTHGFVMKFMANTCPSTTGYQCQNQDPNDDENNAEKSLQVLRAEVEKDPNANLKMSKCDLEEKKKMVQLGFIPRQSRKSLRAQKIENEIALQAQIIADIRKNMIKRRFIQAILKIVTRNRADKRIEMFKSYFNDNNDKGVEKLGNSLDI